MTKTITAAFLAIAMATPLVASDSCNMTAKTAELYMQAHQNGVPLSEMLAINSKNNLAELNPLLIAAYERPRFSSDAAKRRAVAGFRDEVHVICLNNALESE